MQELRTVLADNLRKLRKERNLSLDAVAQASGVSKSMLGQIERGTSNPTIQTVWKIANGLHVSLSTLMNLSETEPSIVSLREIPPIVGDGGRFRVFPVFPFHADSRFEILAVELDAEARSDSEAHAPGTVEFILVVEGSVSVRIGAEEHSLSAGDSMKYRADRPHAYRNSGLGKAAFRMVMFYPD